MADETESDWDVRLPGLARLRALTRGVPEVRVAILDGPVDPAAIGRQGLVPSGPVDHGTLVASIVAGSGAGRPEGLAPGCTVLAIPIFEVDSKGAATICPQERLADAIGEAVSLGAHVINISAAQPEGPLALSTALGAALASAFAKDVLVIAAAGNGGCACDVIPASCPGVLAVGAHGPDGRPLPGSNWGPGLRGGILAPGLQVQGACAGGGTCRGSGTSYAAAIVTGVAALLTSVDAALGRTPSGRRIQDALVRTAAPCPRETVDLCGPYLAGRLDVAAATDRIAGPERKFGEDDGGTMTDTLQAETGAIPAASSRGETEAGASPSGLSPAHGDCGCGGSSEKGGCSCGCSSGKEGCGCGGKGGRPQLVYAIGRLGISFPSVTRRDSLWRTLHATDGSASDQIELKPITKPETLALFDREPWQAQSVVWTISRTEVPMYAIVPSGAFGAEAYAWLVREWADSNVEFISLPGVIAGQVTLWDGQRIDAVVPDLRGMLSWNARVYVDALLKQFRLDAPGGRRKGQSPPEDGAGDDPIRRRLDRFLRKIQFSIRNRGLLPQERAINAAATNAFNLSDVIVQAGDEGLALRDITVEPSPLNRPGGEYYDVLFTFFSPTDRQAVAPLVARFTVDVSDTVPVVVGEPVTWYDY